jgi:hypothetical protein
MIFALQYATGTLLWAFFLLTFIMYFFAIAFTQATTEEIIKAGDHDEELAELHHNYGTLGRSYLSLFLAITGGVSWGELTVSLMARTHWVNMGLFVTFIAITVFGVLNVIISVFVESALASVQHYKDLLIESSNKRKEVCISHFKEVFTYIDDDKSGEISLEEMEEFVCDKHLSEYLESIDIQVDDVRKLFCLLDEDQSGSVSIDEFCEGCLKMKGEAKSYDIQCLLYESRRMLNKWQEYMRYMDNGFIPRILDEMNKRCQDGTMSLSMSTNVSSRTTIDGTPKRFPSQ